MDEMSYIQQIWNRIERCRYGQVFVVADFLDIANHETVRQSLNRIARDGHIIRVMRGVYCKSEFNQFLGEYILPHPNAVAEAIARNYGWNIVPCGETALNLLGLSTQVPAVWSYVSDGLYREYRYGNVLICFKRTMNRQITNFSKKTAMIIQAIRSLGMENITLRDIEKISAQLNYKEKAKIIQEAKIVPGWIYKIIRDICRR